MINLLHNWKGPVEVDGTLYNNIAELDLSTILTNTHIILHTNSEKANKTGSRKAGSELLDSNTYKIKVRQYMTRKGTPDFNFMQKWNNDVPMPMRVMVGEKIKETPGMVYMRLHGDILTEITPCCMKCGKKLTNKVSQYFGMGPECGGHNYISPFNTQAELNNAVQEYKKVLQNITWEGWVIKKAIEEEEVIV